MKIDLGITRGPVAASLPTFTARVLELSSRLIKLCITFGSARAYQPSAKNHVKPPDQETADGTYQV